MASAHFSSQACLTLDSTQRSVYAGIDIGTSVLGVSGALYQIITWRSRRNSSKNNRPRIATKSSIIFCLAAADILSCIFVFAKSVELLLISRPNVVRHDECVYVRDESYVYFDSPIALLGDFSYITSFMWTFCYALDIYFQLRERFIPMVSYHVLSWGTALIITAFKALILHMRSEDPSLSLTCSSQESGNNCILPSTIAVAAYLAFYLPIVFVMLACSILFSLSLPKIRKIGIGTARMLTNQQRKKYRKIARKFFLIVFFFCVCWIFNGINGIYLLVKGSSKSDSPFVFYVLEALTNPMQGFFNAFVFGKHQEAKKLCQNLWQSRCDSISGSHLLLGDSA